MTTVPDNIRTKFSAATINTAANTREESNKESVYSDSYQVPTQDTRATKPVSVINQTKEFHNVEDDSTELGELKNSVSKLQNSIDSQSTVVSHINDSLGTIPAGHTVAGDISSMNQDITDLGPRRIFCTTEITELSGAEPITTETLYDTLKTTLTEGSVFIGEVNISDGPAGASTHLGIFAYATTDHITDGESVYSRVYILATEKTVAPYFWYYNTGVWRSIMLMEDYENFKIKSSTPGSTKKFQVSINDSGTLSATEII